MYSYAWAEGVVKSATEKYGRVHTYCRKIVGCDERKLVYLVQNNLPGWQEYKRMLKAADKVLARVGWEAMVGPNYHTFVQQILHQSAPHDGNTLFGDLQPRSSVQYARRAQHERGTSAASSIIPSARS